MCIYCNTNKYRKIYENHYGSIPKDRDGRTCDIHHNDGNHSNNAPQNLRAVTIQEHYDIHYGQGEWAACLIMSDRMKISPEEKSRLCVQENLKRIKEGTHNLIGSRNPNSKRIADGTHNWLGPSSNKKKLANGTHVSQNPMQRELQKVRASKSSRKQVLNGTHNFLGGDIQRESNKKRFENGTHPFQFKWKCPHCGKEGIGKPNANRWHFDNCKSKE